MECYTSRKKLLGLLALTAVMTAGCYYCATLPGRPAQIIGWIGVAFFGLGLIVIPARFFQKGPFVIIDSRQTISELMFIPAPIFRRTVQGSPGGSDSFSLFVSSRPTAHYF